MRRAACLLAALLTFGTAEESQAVEVEVCFNYGCLQRQVVTYTEAQMRSLHTELEAAADAAEERERLQYVVARMHRWAGEQ